MEPVARVFVFITLIFFYMCLRAPILVLSVVFFNKGLFTNSIVFLLAPFVCVCILCIATPLEHVQVQCRAVFMFLVGRWVCWVGTIVDYSTYAKRNV